MPSDWDNFFRKAEQARQAQIQAEEQKRQAKIRAEQEAERKRQEEAERQRQLVEQRRKASIQRVINQFDGEIRSLLRGYAAAKMRGRAEVLTPSPDSWYPTWRIKCSGYVGVSVTLNLDESSGELVPAGFSISGTNGGRTQTGPSISDLANALAPSVPTVYTPPSCSCDSHGGMSFSVCP